KAAFPRRALAALPWDRAAVGPGEDLGAVVARVDDDRVVGNLESIELREHQTDIMVVLEHAVGVDAVSALARPLRRQMRPHVHPGGVEPHEERLALAYRSLHELHRTADELVVDRFHPLARQRPGVLAAARGRAIEHPAWRVLRAEFGIFRVLGVLGL